MIEYGIASLNLKTTTRLCDFLSEIKFTQLEPAVLHAAKRGLLDWLGCALVGSPHPTVSILLDVLRASSDTGRATVLGRNLKLGVLEAALANGLMGHVLDFDDTHMQGVILHTSAPVLAALLAIAETHPISGREFIAAYVAGFEAGVRVGRAAPGHHAGGWHLTGTLGTIAAAAACGRVLKLSPVRLAHALGIGATQAAGMQQNRGTMCKSLHAGKAAQNGVLAALLAQQGFDSSIEILEGKRGFCRIYSDMTHLEAILENPGQPWEITRNGFKPYACGVVMHPAIDAMIELRKMIEGDAGAIDRIEIVVNPIAVAVTGVSEPRSGLQSKFSLNHSAAVAFLDGTAGVRQYTDERAHAADVKALRQKLVVVTDASYRKDQASARAQVDGRTLEARVEHATGTTHNPMTDEALERKFMTNTLEVLSEARALELRDKVWALEDVEDMRSITGLCAG
jgi:2-methylcitrate dehydratase PrpD